MAKAVEPTILKITKSDLDADDFYIGPVDLLKEIARRGRRIVAKGTNRDFPKLADSYIGRFLAQERKP